MHRRAIENFAVLPQRQMVGDGNRFGMGDEEAVIVSLEWRPAAHARRGTRPVKIDRGIATETVTRTIGRKMPLMASPSQLGRLQRFRNEAHHRQGQGMIGEASRPGLVAGIQIEHAAAPAHSNQRQAGYVDRFRPSRFRDQ